MHNTKLRIDINTIPPDIAHNNNFNFDIGRSSIHNNNSLPGANNKQHIESAPRVHQCKEKTVKAAHPFCVAPPFFKPRLHALCAIHLCPHHPPKVWPWVFGKLGNKSKNLRACVGNAILAAAPLQWATLQPSACTMPHVACRCAQVAATLGFQ